MSPLKSRLVYTLSAATTILLTDMAHVCDVCKEEISKYKCSTCFSPYCSLNCWKKHKDENNCTVKDKVEETAVAENCNDRKKYFTEDTIDENKLRLLDDSKRLKDILRNKYLQSTLKAIDNSTNPEEAIKQAMRDPEFVEFVDECLKVVEDSHD